MRKKEYSREYDDYHMPAYDPTIPPDERKRRVEECDRILAEMHAKVIAEWNSKEK